MTKRKQEVWYEVKFSDDHEIPGLGLSGAIQGTNDKNLLSKITEKLRSVLVGYNLDGGATITFRVAAAEPVEFTNPDR